ncbi:MAG: aspartate carbamoyltransferase catalytic subunit [Firmicutes bacterium]|nr:aspartate carbamoyltransferase catalytic subunit [Bacillota bacterium]
MPPFRGGRPRAGHDHGAGVLTVEAPLVHPGSLVGLAGLPAGAIERLLDRAEAWLAAWERGSLAPVLFGRSVALWFAEPSTRTRVSFEQAASLLGARAIVIGERGTSLEKGETLADTAATLQATGVDAVVVRHAASGVPEQLAHAVRIPVLNAGDGTHEHPTQGLLDALTVRCAFGRVAGLRVAIVGDVLHSRVARSTTWALAALGAHVVLCGPPTLVPAALAQALPAEVEQDLHRALQGADVVMALRLQKERMAAAYLPSEEEYRALWGITAERLQWARPHALFLHPGPSNRGVEVESDVHDGPRSLVRQQVRHGVAVRMAVLERALGEGAAAWPS